MRPMAEWPGRPSSSIPFPVVGEGALKAAVVPKTPPPRSRAFAFGAAPTCLQHPHLTSP